MKYEAIIIIGLLLTIGILMYRQKRNKDKLIGHLRKMIEDASDGTFCESDYKETQLSELETEMWHYLSNSNLSKKQMEEQKEKMQTLISDISHQTVTPIANIKIYTELIEEQIKSENPPDLSNQEMVQEVAAIKKQADKLDFLIQSLVKLSRLENGVITLEPKENDIQDVIDAVYAQYAMKAKEKDIDFTAENTVEKAVFDSKWTTEALGNIVDNAIKYTNPHGKIRIRIEKYQLFLRIDVIDNGIGIKEEDMAKISNRFYRARNVAKEQGVGIGLFLANEILKRENGYMKVSSKVGEGSTFSMFLYRG